MRLNEAKSAFGHSSFPLRVALPSGSYAKFVGVDPLLYGASVCTFQQTHRFKGPQIFSYTILGDPVQCTELGNFYDALGVDSFDDIPLSLCS